MGRTCERAAVGRIDAEHEAYLESEHQHKHGLVAGGTRVRSQLAREWEARTPGAGGGKRERAYIEGLSAQRSAPGLRSWGAETGVSGGAR